MKTVQLGTVKAVLEHRNHSDVYVSVESDEGIMTIPTSRQKFLKFKEQFCEGIGGVYLISKPSRDRERAVMEVLSCVSGLTTSHHAQSIEHELQSFFAGMVPANEVSELLEELKAA